MKVPGGYIIAVEGIDAVGKRTQTTLLSKWLETKQIKVARMSFPDYRTTIGKEIKRFLSTASHYPLELQHLLFAANRWEKYGEIEARLRAGDVLVIDRYTESNLAYGVANGLDINWLSNLERGMPRADLVLLLDASAESLRSRRPGRSKDAYEQSSSLQSKAQNAYRRLARHRRWRLIDASGSLGEVQAAVEMAVAEALKNDRGIII